MIHEMRPTRATVTAATALAVAAVTAVSASVALATGGQSEQVQEFSVAVPADRPVAGGPGMPRSAAGTTAPATRTAPTPTAAPVQPPRRVSVPAIGVTAPVVPTGVTRAGNAQIPRDGDVVGWYEYGAAPGDSRGSAVLIGHRDTEAEGPGALFDLDQLRPGARIVVDQGGRDLRYQVVALRSTEKSGLPDSLFRRTGPHQLVLITCGGPYIAAAGGYQDNLFAIAVPEGRSK
jgi:LPXTG-site transpeptidase (sortase) family protein